MFARPCLPSSTQRWAHGTSSIAQMHTAIEDESITAIEADIVMGSETGNNDSVLTPILAHPPDRESDLSFRHFLNTSVRNGQIQKHLKLDFKEIEAVQPSFEIMKTMVFERNEKFVFLNADILPDPKQAVISLFQLLNFLINVCKSSYP
ncbi:DUF2181-containing protein [Fragilaria crotonensis]|nr:DUF2181-containing protein [Fragilaria crotonensis]